MFAHWLGAHGVSIPAVLLSALVGGLLVLVVSHVVAWAGKTAKLRALSRGGGPVAFPAAASGTSARLHANPIAGLILIRGESLWWQAADGTPVVDLTGQWLIRDDLARLRQFASPLFDFQPFATDLDDEDVHGLRLADGGSAFVVLPRGVGAALAATMPSGPRPGGPPPPLSPGKVPGDDLGPLLAFALFVLAVGVGDLAAAIGLGLLTALITWIVRTGRRVDQRLTTARSMTVNHQAKVLDPASLPLGPWPVDHQSLSQILMQAREQLQLGEATADDPRPTEAASWQQATRDRLALARFLGWATLALAGVVAVWHVGVWVRLGATNLALAAGGMTIIGVHFMYRARRIAASGQTLEARYLTLPASGADKLLLYPTDHDSPIGLLDIACRLPARMPHQGTLTLITRDTQPRAGTTVVPVIAGTIIWPVAPLATPNALTINTALIGSTKPTKRAALGNANGLDPHPHRRDCDR